MPRQVPLMRIVIEIRGGCLAAVHAEEEAEVVLVDWDDFHAEPNKFAPGIFPTEPMSSLHPETAELITRINGPSIPDL